MIKHYEGILGKFDYNSKEFKIVNTPYVHLHYKGKGLSVNLPKGCINTRYMFYGCILPEGFTLYDFDTSGVTDMHGMFSECNIPNGFSLGNKFDTSKVEDMSGMFEGCTFPDGFSLGEGFDTSNVISMLGMFRRCTIPKVFSLGDKFNISKVRNVSFMFQDSKLSIGTLDTDDAIEIINYLKPGDSIKVNDMSLF